MTEPVTQAYLERVFEQVKNWGKWGPEDERGALNTITPAKRAAAAALVESGEVVSCSRPFAVRPEIDNRIPAQHMMIAAGDTCDPSAGFGHSADYIGLSFHGMAVSHIDALCHVFVRGKMYNDFDASEVKSTGAKRNSISVARQGIATRGVFLDIPRLRGVDWLELTDRITPEDLNAAAESQGVQVEPGDTLLVGTGREARRAERGPWPVGDGLAGLHATCIPWLHEREIAVLGSDGISDSLPSPPGDWPLPVHQCCLVAMGVHLLDNLAFEELTQTCRQRNRWEFFFVVAPLYVKRATGSPVNPIAIF